MSVTASEADGVITFTLTVDPKSPCPPLCQVLKSLCYSPVCCSVSERLRGVQRTFQSVLGTLQIMVGLLSIGLCGILSSTHTDFLWLLNCTAFPYWSGALFIVFGIMGFLSEKRSSPCVITLTVILNLTGFGIAMAAIVIYTIAITTPFHIGEWNCEISRYRGYEHTTLNPSVVKILQEKCLEGNQLTMMLMRSMKLVLIVLSCLEVGVTMTSVFLGIKTLHEGQNKGYDDPKLYKPGLEEVTTQPAA